MGIGQAKRGSWGGGDRAIEACQRGFRAIAEGGGVPEGGCGEGAEKGWRDGAEDDGGGQEVGRAEPDMSAREFPRRWMSSVKILHGSIHKWYLTHHQLHQVMNIM